MPDCLGCPAGGDHWLLRDERLLPVTRTIISGSAKFNGAGGCQVWGCDVRLGCEVSRTGLWRLGAALLLTAGLDLSQ